MEEERITLRIGQEEAQSLDDFLAKHPELGSRSNFVRTALREYINRDADVPAAKPQKHADRDACVVFPDGSGEITVRLTKRQVDTLRMEVEELGLYVSAGELIRSWFAYHHATEEAKKSVATEAYERADPKRYAQ